MMFVLLGTFYASMVVAGYIVELLFGTTGLIPTHRGAMVMQAGISWNYTTWLNIAFLVVARSPAVALCANRRHANAAHDGRFPRRRTGPPLP